MIPLSSTNRLLCDHHTCQFHLNIWIALFCSLFGLLTIPVCILPEMPEICRELWVIKDKKTEIWWCKTLFITHGWVEPILMTILFLCLITQIHYYRISNLDIFAARRPNSINNSRALSDGGKIRGGGGAPRIHRLSQSNSIEVKKQDIINNSLWKSVGWNKSQFQIMVATHVNWFYSLRPLQEDHSCFTEQFALVWWSRNV